MQKNLDLIHYIKCIFVNHHTVLWVNSKILSALYCADKYNLIHYIKCIFVNHPTVLWVMVNIYYSHCTEQTNTYLIHYIKSTFVKNVYQS